MVHCRSSLDRALETLAHSSVTAVGMDTETRPTFGSMICSFMHTGINAFLEGSSSPPVSLLQVATRSSVFLFDLKIMHGLSDYGALVHSLLTNDNVWKIGAELNAVSILS